jgi:tripartite-type tricarboxylate transporter receptor subunit TctC
VEGGTFFAILGPAKMPRGVVDTLNREINRALQLPDVRERLTSLGIEIAGGTPEALAATIAADVQKWAKLVKERNLKFE